MNRPICKRITTASAIGFLVVIPAHAAGINGLWANDLSVCSKIFKKHGNQISMAKNADFYGSGFIINGKNLRGKLGNCKVTARKDNGARVQLTAECSTEISTSTQQFSLRVDGADKLTRSFPGMPEMSMTYYRCP